MKHAADLAAEINRTHNAAHLYSAVLYFQATDQPLKAKASMARASLHDNTFCFYFAASCLQTTPDPQTAIVEFEKRIGSKYLNGKYVQLARAMLYAIAGRGYQEIEPMLGDCLTDASPLIRKWALVPLKLSLHEEGEFIDVATAASSDFEFQGSETDYERGDVLSLHYLAGKFREDFLLEKTTGKSLPESVVNFVIGVRRLSAGEDEAEHYLQQSIEANHVTFDAAWARALLEHLPKATRPASKSTVH